MSNREFTIWVCAGILATVTHQVWAYVAVLLCQLAYWS